MINQLLLAILLTIAPVSELRAGMPLGILYALENNIPVFPIILLIIIVNCAVVFLIFLFLDKFHNSFMNIKWYKKFYESYLRGIQWKVDKFEKKHSAYGMIALTLFVAIPLPITGAWTGTLISWLLGLERKKSLIAIFAGIVIAGTIVSLLSLGIINLVNSS